MCVSAEAGDYDESMEGTDYVAEFVLLPNQTPKQNEKIQAMHKTLGYLYTPHLNQFCNNKIRE